MKNTCFLIYVSVTIVWMCLKIVQMMAEFGSEIARGYFSHLRGECVLINEFVIHKWIIIHLFISGKFNHQIFLKVYLIIIFILNLSFYFENELNCNGTLFTEELKALC